MAKDINLYLDDSNVFIEGRKVSAVHKGMAANVNVAASKKISDGAYRLDFGRLIEITCGYNAVTTAKFYGSRPPKNDSVWAAAKQHGFQLNIFDRSKFGKEKKVDTTIVRDITVDIIRNLKPATDSIVLVSGDADFVPAVDLAKQEGYHVKVAYWDHCSQELKKAASEFQSLNQHLHDLTHYRGKS